MRLWSLHPKYLDAKGLVALWREGLLAQHVLQGKTKGYTNHPQLQRFSSHSKPIDAITMYLHTVADEADVRGYHFDRSKLMENSIVESVPLNSKQLEYEVLHLKRKLEVRDKKFFQQLLLQKEVEAHPLFIIRTGPVESWEITKEE